MFAASTMERLGQTRKLLTLVKRRGRSKRGAASAARTAICGPRRIILRHLFLFLRTKIEKANGSLLGGRRNGLFLRCAGNDIDTVFRNHNEVIGDLKNLLDQGGVLILGAHQHLCLGRRIFTQKSLALCGVIEVIEQNGHILLDCNARGMLQGLFIGNIDFRGNDGCACSSRGGRNGRAAASQGVRGRGHF